MDDLEILRASFVSFLDGLWWGLRDHTGPLSMYEGYENGFRQVGSEMAERIGGHGPEAAAKIAAQIMGAIGLKTEAKGNDVIVSECPLWNRILQKGLEFSFHVEEICWKPLLEGIGEKAGAKAYCITSLRLNYIAKSKADYKKSKAKKALERGDMSQEDFDQRVKRLDSDATKIPTTGQYRFQ